MLEVIRSLLRMKLEHISTIENVMKTSTDEGKRYWRTPLDEMSADAAALERVSKMLSR